MAFPAAELADDGTIRRRISGRVRSGKMQHHSDHYSGPQLYTVVTMDPNDEVCCAVTCACCPPCLITVRMCDNDDHHEMTLNVCQIT